MNRLRDANDISDAWEVAMDLAKNIKDPIGLRGYGVVLLTDGDGEIKDIEPFANIITNAGDTYYARMGVVGVSPANVTAPTLVSRMKLGTGATAPSKAAGTNEVIQTYIAGSVLAFDASFPTAGTASANSGANATYKTTWPAGTVTNAAITEATITSSAADAQGAAADTIARITFAAKNKTVDDSLAITWAHLFKGA